MILSIMRLGWLWISAVILALDYYSKQWASTEFAVSSSKLSEFITLKLVHNSGIAFGLLNNLEDAWIRWYLIGVTSTISLVLFIWLMHLRSHQRWLAVAITLLLGGALGNLYDRVEYSHVIDFIQLHAAGFQSPVFNVADIAISIGVIMLILESLFSSRNR